MKYAVVGNGRSARNCPALIDNQDMIVRCDAWWAANPPPAAGNRCHVLAWCGELTVFGLREPNATHPWTRPGFVPHGNYSIWVERNSAYKQAVTRALGCARAIVGDRPFNMLNKEHDAELRKWLETWGKHPSTLLRALNRVVRDPLCHHLLLAGADDPNDQPAIAALIRGEWCREQYEIKVRLEA